MEKTLRFAILGCGGISAVHAEAIGMTEGAELAACYDISGERAAVFADRYGITAFADRDQLFRSDIDVICVCTPSAFHSSDAAEALLRGKHVILEKPMSLTSEEADTVISASEKSGKLVSVISQARYADDIREARKVLENGALGNIGSVNLFMRYWRDAEYFSGSVWRGRKSMEGGGALMNQGIHGISLLRYLCGEPVVVSATAATITHPIETEDTICALLRYNNGAHGVIEASTCSWPGFCRRIEIYGDKGYMVITEDRITRLKTVDTDYTIPGNEAPVYRGYPGRMEPILHARQISELVSAVNNGGQLIMNGYEGKADIKLIETIYSAAGI